MLSPLTGKDVNSGRNYGMRNAYQSEAEKFLLEIANSVRKKRRQLGLTQEQLAEGLDLSNETIKHIEQARGWISLQMLFYICKEMGIKITVG